MALPRRGQLLALLAIAAALVAAGALLGSQLRPSVSGSSPEAGERADPRVDALQIELETERRARLALTRELADLGARLEAALDRSRLQGPGAPLEKFSNDVLAGSVPPSRSPSSKETRGTEKTEAEGPILGEEALAGMGFNRVDAEKLRQRWERLELDRLELSDRAMREGWFMTPRHVDEYRGLDAAFKADLGEAGYDAYLYATGQDNRVLVRDVLAGSAASAADIQPGDEIVGYDGMKIYAKTELPPLTAAGARGDLVTIDLIRRGQPLSIRVQRGPLGVVLGSAREAPRQP